MAKITVQEAESKSKALSKAFEDLAAISTVKDNQATQENVCEIANQFEVAKTWQTPISVQSLKNKNPKGFAFEVRNKIIKFKEDLKKLESVAEDKLVADIDIKNKTIETLTIRITELLHNEIELKDKIAELYKTIERKNEEIQSLKTKR